MMSTTRMLAALGFFVGTAQSQTFNTSGWAPQWLNASGGCSSTPHVESSCAELSEGMVYVDTTTTDPRLGGGGLFWTPPSASTPHATCNPLGDSGAPGNQCGTATYRIYCSTAATVIFQAQVRAYSEADRGRDDSFWAWVDDRQRVTEFSGSFAADSWVRRQIWSNGFVFAAGTHDLVIGEREDGAMMRHMTMLSGYPACQFGAPPPGYNITTLALSDALDDAQVRLVNATDQIAVLQAMQLQANLTMQNMSQLVASLSGQLQTLQGSASTNYTALSTQVMTTTQNLTARVGATESRIANMLQALAAVVPPSTGGGSASATAPGSVSQNGDNVIVSAPGGVKFSSGGSGAASQCYQTDLCDLAQALNAALAVFGTA